MGFFAYMKETLDSGDPTVRTWTFVDSYYLPFLMSSLYVFFVKRLGPHIMKNRKPFDLRRLMVVYNFLVVFTYTICLLTLAGTFLTTDAYKTLCSPCIIRKGHYTYVAVSAGWFIYILKYFEYADTVFFVLRKKDHLITNLHVIHHAVLPIICWIMLRTETSGFQFIPGFLNSAVHIIMYTYYGLAAMGPEYQKHLWWKEHLTKIQMAQFVIVLIFVFLGIPLSGCKTSTHGIYIDIFFAFLFLVLFYNFYTKTYKKSPIARQSSKGSRDELFSDSLYFRDCDSSDLKKNGSCNGSAKNGDCNGLAKNGDCHGLIKNGDCIGLAKNGDCNGSAHNGDCAKNDDCDGNLKKRATADFKSS